MKFLRRTMQYGGAYIDIWQTIDFFSFDTYIYNDLRYIAIYNEKGYCTSYIFDLLQKEKIDIKFNLDKTLMPSITILDEDFDTFGKIFESLNKNNISYDDVR